MPQAITAMKRRSSPALHWRGPSDQSSQFPTQRIPSRKKATRPAQLPRCGVVLLQPFQFFANFDFPVPWIASQKVSFARKH